MHSSVEPHAIEVTALSDFVALTFAIPRDASRMSTTMHEDMLVDRSQADIGDVLFIDSAPAAHYTSTYGHAQHTYTILLSIV